MARLKPGWMWAALLVACVCDAGFPMAGVRVRLTEVALLLLALTAWRESLRVRADAPSPSSLPSRSLPPLIVWLAGGYLICAIVSAYGRGLGSVRFEVEAMAAGWLAWRQCRRAPGWSLLAAASAVILVSGLSALALSALGWRAVWFSASDTVARLLSFGEGGVPEGGLLQLGGTFGHKNILASVLVLGLPVALLGAFGRIGKAGTSNPDTLENLSVSAWGRPRSGARSVDGISGFSGLSAGAFCVGAIVLWLTDALFGIVAAAFGLLLGGASRGGWRMGRALACALVTAAGLGLQWIVETGEIGALGAGRGGSIPARTHLWREGVRLVREHPGLGIGRVGFEAHVDGGFAHAHNLFLMKYVETGVIGGTLFAALMVLCLAAALRALFPRKQRRAGSSAAAPDLEAAWKTCAMAALAAGLAAFVLYSFTDYFYNEPPVMMLFWVAAGFALGPRTAASASEPQAGR